MSFSSLSLTTRGLLSPTGLRLVTRGLVLEALQVGDAGPVAGGGLMADARITFDAESLSGDLRVVNGQLEPEAGLLTAVVISLFTDRRARADDPLPARETNRRGWWGDVLPEAAGDQIGSRLWLLSREKTTEQVRLRAIEYAREALAWLREDGIAEDVEIEAEIQRPNAGVPSVLALGIRIVKPEDREIAFRFRYVWPLT